MTEFHHISVLLKESIEGLNIRPEGIYLDGTLGGAGHSAEIAKRLTTGRLIGVDRDPKALAAAEQRLAPWMDRVELVHSNFRELDAILDSLGIPAVDGILLDLGVSSPQLDEADRGFSYMADAPLIAAAIVRRREQAPIETTLELVDVIRSAMPQKALREKQHPAKRSFQAIRIAVNDELGAVDAVMRRAIDRLKPGGRLAVITFHSLEDRIVKNAMAEAVRGCTCPPEFPVCVCGKKPKLKLIARKPITAGEEELERNPRARSAKLRVAERLQL